MSKEGAKWLWETEFSSKKGSLSHGIDYQDLLSGFTIAFAKGSHLILRYPLSWSLLIQSLEGSLSHSLFTRLIGFSPKLYYIYIKLSIQKLLVIGAAQRVMSLEFLSGFAMGISYLPPCSVGWSFVIHSVDLSARVISVCGFGFVRLSVQPKRHTSVQSRA